MCEINLELLNALSLRIKESKLTLALAESMSAGYFSAIWSMQVYSGDFFKGSIIAFANEVKEDILKVDKELIKEFSAESIPVTEAMAKGLQNVIPSAIQIAITGLAYGCDDPQERAKVGDVFISIGFQGKQTSRSFSYGEDLAADIFIQAFNSSLVLLADVLAAAD